MLTANSAPSTEACMVVSNTEAFSETGRRTSSTSTQEGDVPARRRAAGCLIMRDLVRRHDAPDVLCDGEHGLVIVRAVRLN
jgi:hypothetical protein